ncbi:hypothetical protein USDA257_c31210 [Sinorhizobium fredii USDA 257]|nr:hypothetical protein USDA257_c31210 [Sinorhizobium fredii USDA 257]
MLAARFAKSLAAAPPPGLAGAAESRSGSVTQASLLEQSLPHACPGWEAPAKTGASIQLDKAHGGNMSWHKPKFIEVSCAMEITRYAPADGDEPILF